MSNHRSQQFNFCFRRASSTYIRVAVVEVVTSPYRLTRPSPIRFTRALATRQLSSKKCFVLTFLLKAQIALDEGEVPVGCVLVHRGTGRVVSFGHNETNATCNVRAVSDFI